MVEANTRGSARPAFLPSAALGGLLLLAAASAALAQTPQGATLTVTGGTVAVVKASGAAMQPASSGMTLGVGDRVATVGSSSALVTFFEGSELELASETTIILREITATGNEVQVTVEDVLGTTVSRVKAFASPNSVYTIQTPGGRVVALVRGSTVGFTQFSSGGTLVKADCTRACTVLFEDSRVCEGNKFSCGVDPNGGVTDDPSYDGDVLDKGGGQGGHSEDDKGGGGGTIGR